MSLGVRISLISAGLGFSEFDTALPTPRFSLGGATTASLGCFTSSLIIFVMSFGGCGVSCGGFGSSLGGYGISFVGFFISFGDVIEDMLDISDAVSSSSSPALVFFIS